MLARIIAEPCRHGHIRCAFPPLARVNWDKCGVSTNRELTMKHFRISIAVTIILMGVACWWGYSRGGLAGLAAALWITTVLGVLEVSLSFDNAVVNASVLRHWNDFWRKLFLTVGILIAVFGMRLVFPLLIVAIATGLGMIDVWRMAINTPAEYSRHLTENHAQVAAFGGVFLLLLFLNFLFDEEKELHWLGWVEEKIGKYGSESLAVLVTLCASYGAMVLVPEAQKLSVLASGGLGVMVYVGVKWISSLLEEKKLIPHWEKLSRAAASAASCTLRCSTRRLALTESLAPSPSPTTSSSSCSGWPLAPCLYAR